MRFIRIQKNARKYAESGFTAWHKLPCLDWKPETGNSPDDKCYEVPEKLEDVVIVLQLRHDEVDVERHSGDDVNDVDWGSDDTHRASLPASP